MSLEKIIQKRTLADGFVANDRLKKAVIKLGLFYGANTLLFAAALLYLKLAGSNDVSPLPRLISTLGIPLLMSELLGFAGLGLISALTAGALWLSARLRIPLLSLLTALLSTVAQLCNLSLIGLLGAGWFFAAVNRTDRGLSLEYMLQSLGFSGSKDTAAIILLLVCGVELLVWIVLLLPTVSRSVRATVSATRQVPGPYAYSYSSIVMSSSQNGNEIAFLEDSLRAKSSHFRYADELENVYDRSNYLVRFLHRGGRVLAASLHHRSTRELIAIFPGRESSTLNTEVLLEDSYQIQKARRPIARATLSKNQLLESSAQQFGWTVVTDDDGLLQLERE